MERASCLLRGRCGGPAASTQLRTDNASLIGFRQRIAQFSSSRTDSSSLRLVAEVTTACNAEAVVASLSSGGCIRESVPVALQETSQIAGKTMRYVR